MPGIHRVRQFASAVAILGFALLAVAPAMAGPILWDLSNVATGAGTAAGSFTFDGSNVGNVSVFVQSTGGYFTAVTMDSAYFSDPNDLEFATGGSNPNHVTLQLSATNLETLLTTSGSITLSNESSIGWCTPGCNNTIDSGLSSGTLTATTPEPATWALLGSGTLMLLGLGWRRRAAVHAARAR